MWALWDPQSKRCGFSILVCLIRHAEPKHFFFSLLTSTMLLTGFDLYKLDYIQSLVKEVSFFPQIELFSQHTIFHIQGEKELLSLRGWAAILSGRVIHFPKLIILRSKFSSTLRIPQSDLAKSQEQMQQLKIALQGFSNFSSSAPTTEERKALPLKVWNITISYLRNSFKVFLFYFKRW